MELILSHSSIFQNKKIKCKNKKPTKSGMIWINFSKIRKARCTLAPFGSPNTVYAVYSLHFALPYFAPLRSVKHRIYWNDLWHPPSSFLYFLLCFLGCNKEFWTGFFLIYMRVFWISLAPRKREWKFSFYEVVHLVQTIIWGK